MEIIRKNIKVNHNILVLSCLFVFNCILVNHNDDDVDESQVF